MDTSNTIDPINFLVTGKASSLSNEEWAKLIWRVVEEIRPSFEHFLGFRPLREFYERTSSGETRSFMQGSLICSLKLDETYCKELVVLLATSRGALADAVRTELCEERSLLITRQAEFLIQDLKYTIFYNESGRQEVTFCKIMMLSCEDFAELLRRGDSIRSYKKVIDSVVALAGDTWRRRQKMVEKDLETYKKLQAISGRILNL